ncbi:hypothetical protein [Desulfonema limicola]|uniref:hypothetical protein n=1 Tax=Desulfonema limicola TaxID=45656 RepID=UPI001A9AD4A2|nr:hypothetical protein [Desulfonema limicola]
MNINKVITHKVLTDLYRMPGIGGYLYIPVYDTRLVCDTTIDIDSSDNLNMCYAYYVSNGNMKSLMYATKHLRPIPTAEAGQNQIVLDNVTLDGSLSTDPDNDIASYSTSKHIKNHC